MKSIKEQLERLESQFNIFTSEATAVQSMINALEKDRIQSCTHDFDPHICKKCGMFKTDKDYQMILFKKANSNV